MEKFIYVFDDKSKEAMLNSGFVLYRSDENKHMHIFLNQDNLVFNVQNIACVYSNTLTF